MQHHSKSWFGVKEVTFLGLHLKNHLVFLSNNRIQEVQKLIMPINQKQMQSFMGFVNFFRPFIGGDDIIFSDLTALLTSMTHKDFNWIPSTWTQDYAAIFENVKKAMLHTMSLHLPNYDIEWRLQPDASSVAVGAGLINEDLSEDRQLIGLYSKKFSPVAPQRWDTIKQEAFAIASSVKFFADLLGGRPFLIECNHNNLCLAKLALYLTPIFVR